MSTIRPRNDCWIISRTESWDGNGRPIHKVSKKKTKCAIVSLHDATDESTVRADSSASRGRAEEHISDGRLLLKPSETLKLGDVIEVAVKGGDNIKITVRRIFRRVDIAGVVHHIDIEGDVWVSE